MGEPQMDAPDEVSTPPRIAERTAVSRADFAAAQQAALRDPAAFWGDLARRALDWVTDFTTVRSGDFSGDARVEWFADGVLNVSANCLDRHLAAHGDKIALHWVGDMVGERRDITYRELADGVGRWANLLKAQGVRRGDSIVLYLPMIPEAVMAMLACARIGAVHSVVFAGFSAQAVASRIADCGAKIVITADEGWRAGKIVPLKRTIDAAIDELSAIERVLVVKRTGNDVPMQDGRDAYVETLLPGLSVDCAPEPMNAEDPLFILYTSGSTGTPKGLVQTQAGYLLYAAVTFRTLFDYRANDVYFCTADVGWITGHSYLVYGPLANAATIVLYEGVPTYPTAERCWQIVDDYNVTIFYTAPTAIRSLMQLGDEHLRSTHRRSLRLFGTVGEPINPAAWQWYFETVGKRSCAVVDTWWQTETGGHMIASTPSLASVKPGWAMQPFWGVAPVLINEAGQTVDGAGEGGLFIGQPWPGMARTIHNDHARYVAAYFSQSPGLYCTGDGAIRDDHGNYRITGRVDDVINVSGHRFGTAEIESALAAHPDVAEAAVVGRDHAIKGTGIYAFVTLNHGVTADAALEKALQQQLRQEIGAIASLDWLQIASGLPKTRSGKIMRRILRKIASGETNDLGDVSTLADPGVVAQLISNRVA